MYIIKNIIPSIAVAINPLERYSATRAITTVPAVHWNLPSNFFFFPTLLYMQLSQKNAMH